jgi:hypothetical protein
VDNRYFQWLEKIHLLHHWNERDNFSITNPLTDIVFGTYLSPKKHIEEVLTSMQSNKLTASDFINWRYLLKSFASSRDAALVYTLKQGGNVRKLGQLLSVLRDRLDRNPADAESEDFYRKGVDLLRVIDSDAARETLADLDGAHASRQPLAK